MRSRRFALGSIAAAIGLITVVILPGAAGAAAGTGGAAGAGVAAAPGTRPDVKTLSGRGVSGQFSQVVSPSGCRGRSDNPHLSSTVIGVVNSHAATVCNNAVPSAEVTMVLLKLVAGTWGAVDSDVVVLPYVRQVRGTATEPFCAGTFQYAVNAFHQVTDVDFEQYAGITGSPVVTLTC